MGDLMELLREYDLCICDGKIYTLTRKKLGEEVLAVVNDITDILNGVRIKGDIIINDGKVLIKVVELVKPEEDSESSSDQQQSDSSEQTSILDEVEQPDKDSKDVAEEKKSDWVSVGNIKYKIENGKVTVKHRFSSYNFDYDKVKELYQKLGMEATIDDVRNLSKTIMEKEWTKTSSTPYILFRFIAYHFGCIIKRSNKLFLRKPEYYDSLNIDLYDFDYELIGNHITLKVDSKEFDLDFDDCRRIFDMLPKKAKISDVLRVLKNPSENAVYKAIGLLKFFDRRVEFDAELVKEVSEDGKRVIYYIEKGVESRKNPISDDLKVERELLKDIRV